MLGALGMVSLTALLFWLLTDDAFTVTEESVTFEGLRHAQEAEVRDYLTELDRAPNVFRVRASDIVRDLSLLTEVDAAHATVSLPAQVSVALDERDPIFIWSNREVSWLVDETGMLFRPADGQPALTASPDTQADPALSGSGEYGAGAAARAALPVVEDTRFPPQPTTVGSYLDRDDLAVMRQLLAVSPELLGSQSQQLRLYVDEDEGYVLESTDGGWDAVFGRYTPFVQPPDVVPRQVQCLRWTLATEEEERLERVWLALSDDACGTAKLLDKKRDEQG